MQVQTLEKSQLPENNPLGDSLSLEGQVDELTKQLAELHEIIRMTSVYALPHDDSQRQKYIQNLSDQSAIFLKYFAEKAKEMVGGGASSEASKNTTGYLIDLLQSVPLEKNQSIVEGLGFDPRVAEFKNEEGLIARDHSTCCGPQVTEGEPLEKWQRLILNTYYTVTRNERRLEDQTPADNMDKFRLAHILNGGQFLLGFSAFTQSRVLSSLGESLDGLFDMASTHLGLKKTETAKEDGKMGLIQIGLLVGSPLITLGAFYMFGVNHFLVDPTLRSIVTTAAVSAILVSINGNIRKLLRTITQKTAKVTALSLHSLNDIALAIGGGVVALSMAMELKGWLPSETSKKLGTSLIWGGLGLNLGAASILARPSLASYHEGRPAGVSKKDIAFLEKDLSNFIKELPSTDLELADGIEINQAKIGLVDLKVDIPKFDTLSKDEQKAIALQIAYRVRQQSQLKKNSRMFLMRMVSRVLRADGLKQNLRVRINEDFMFDPAHNHNHNHNHKENELFPVDFPTVASKEEKIRAEKFSPSDFDKDLHSVKTKIKKFLSDNGVENPLDKLEGQPIFACYDDKENIIGVGTQSKNEKKEIFSNKINVTKELEKIMPGDLKPPKSSDAFPFPAALRKKPLSPKTEPRKYVPIPPPMTTSPVVPREQKESVYAL